MPYRRPIKEHEVTSAENSLKLHNYNKKNQKTSPTPSFPLFSEEEISNASNKNQFPTFSLKSDLEMFKTIAHRIESEDVSNFTKLAKFEKMTIDEFCKYFDLYYLDNNLFSDYISKLKNRYFIYVFFEIIDEIKYSNKHINYYVSIHEKKRIVDPYNKTLDILMELKDYFTEDAMKGCNELSYIINNILVTTKKDYQQSLKKSWLLKLENIGLSYTKSIHLIKDLKEFIS